MAQRPRRAAAEAACGQHFCGTCLQRLRNGKRCASGTAQGALRAPLSELLLSCVQLEGIEQSSKATSTFYWRSTLESVCSSFLYSCSVQSSRRRRLLRFFALCEAPASSLISCKLALSRLRGTVHDAALTCLSSARTVISEVPLQQRTALYADSAAAAHLHKAVCQALAAQTLAAPRKRRGQSSD